MVVAGKEKFNWSMMKAIADEFRVAVTERFGEKRKWIGGSIAAYLYLRLSEADREALVKKIAQADASDDELEALMKEVAADEFDKEQGVLNQPKGSRASERAKPGKSR